MSVIATRGKKCYLTKSGITNVELTPTAISAAKPAVITVADTTGLTTGDLAQIKGTDFPELDGQLFPITVINGTTFSLVRSDTSNSSATLGSSPKATIWKRSDMSLTCINTIDITAPSTSVSAKPSWCDEEGSVPGDVTPGSFTINGYIDQSDASYWEVTYAAEDGLTRALDIELPNNGNLVALVNFGAIGASITDSADYAAPGTFAIPLRHRGTTP